MKARYNLRTGPSRIVKKSIKAPVNRRHSLRLSPTAKQQQQAEKSRVTPPIETSDHLRHDDFNDLLARHHRRMLEEQKDRKLYERYVRDQRTLRRLQCRRTHTAHLTEATRTRLLRELERERRYTIHDQICSQLANHLLTFRHGIHGKAIDWSSLEDQLAGRIDPETIREYDVMIQNLKKVSSLNVKSSSSKPRLSVHERQKQRLAATNEIPVSQLSSVLDECHSSSMEHSSPSSHFTVRFQNDDRTSNLPHLICIQNVLSSTDPQQNRSVRSSSPSNRHRSKFISNPLINESTKKRPMEKENCSSTSSTRSYPNTRKHQPITCPTRRQK